MELTCLSEGKGFYFPPCHILELSGFRVLLDCPLDLSALSIFSPVPVDDDQFTDYDEKIDSCSCHKPIDEECNVNKRRRIEKELDASCLIRGEPRYKTVKNLHLSDVSFIDIVLITSPMGMMGMPFLTRRKSFCAKVYVTEAAARIGQLMMEDLVTMHKEFRQFYGPEVSSSPRWMKWEELELLSPEIKDVALGEDGTELGCWMPLYSAGDVKECMQKVQSLKYAEETCYNGTLIIKALSSGLEIGTCNWSIITPKGSLAYLSPSILASATAVSLDYTIIQRSDMILYSGFTPCTITDNSASDLSNLSNTQNRVSFLIDSCSDDAEKGASESSLFNAEEYSEETEKLDFICSCAIYSLKANGSVLIPVGRLGCILELLEMLAVYLEPQNLKVPIYIVSSVAQELMAYMDIIPEWLSKQRQDRLYSGQPLFKHVELLKNKRLHLFPAIHSLELLKIWQEPCIVFCPHWSLRLGPSVHLLRRWCRDENSLLVMEEGLDASLALLPFKPMAMKVLQCSFLSGIPLAKSQPLLKILQPRHVLFPDKLRQYVYPHQSLFSFGYYSENETLRIPNLRENAELDMGIDLASKLDYSTVGQKDVKVARLKGELAMERGKYRLLLGKEQVVSSQDRSVLHFGRIDLRFLQTTLEEKGMKVTVKEVAEANGSEVVSLLHVSDPSQATIEVREVQTFISCADENLASLISEAVYTVSNCI